MIVWREEILTVLRTKAPIAGVKRYPMVVGRSVERNAVRFICAPNDFHGTCRYHCPGCGGGSDKMTRRKSHSRTERDPYEKKNGLSHFSLPLKVVGVASMRPAQHAAPASGDCPVMVDSSEIFAAGAVDINSLRNGL
jgi:hypothetical protein